MNDTMDAQVKRRNLCNCPNCQTDDCPAGVELAECREQLRLANEDAATLVMHAGHSKQCDFWHDGAYCDCGSRNAVCAHLDRVKGNQ